MAKPNYSFEKRQRELAKRKKKEEKRLKKAEAKNNQTLDSDTSIENDDSNGASGDR